MSNISVIWGITLGCDSLQEGDCWRRKKTASISERGRERGSGFFGGFVEKVKGGREKRKEKKRKEKKKEELKKVRGKKRKERK